MTCFAQNSNSFFFFFYKNLVFSEIQALCMFLYSLTIPSEHLPQLSGQSNQSLSISSSPRFISRGFNSIAGILHRLIDEHQLLSGFTPQGFSKTFKNTTLRCCFQICPDCKFQLSYYFNLFLWIHFLNEESSWGIGIMLLHYGWCDSRHQKVVNLFCREVPNYFLKP